MADPKNLDAKVSITWNEYLNLPPDKRQEILNKLRQDGFVLMHGGMSRVHPQMIETISDWEKGIRVRYDVVNIPQIILERTSAHVEKIEIGAEGESSLIYVPTIKGYKTLRDYCRAGHNKTTG